MNKVFLIGRLVRDPELRYTSSNIPSATFSIAIDRNYQSQNGQRETDFINIVVWRNQAENVKKFLTQGSQVAIDGRIQTRSYDAQDGSKRYVTEVVADNVQFLGRPNGSSNSSSQSSADSTTPYDFGSDSSSSTNLESAPFDIGGNIGIDDSDLPF